MDSTDALRQSEIATLNIIVKHTTVHDAVEHDFLVAHWHELEILVRNVELQITEHGKAAEVARAAAHSAVTNGALHHALVEHAVLLAQQRLAGNQR